jgi:hypothetical protein
MRGRALPKLSSTNQIESSRPVRKFENASSFTESDGTRVRSAQDAVVPSATQADASVGRASSTEHDYGFNEPFWSATPADGSPAGWDTDLHLPPWIVPTEHTQISLRLGGWVSELLSTCNGALPEPVLNLLKPVRPLWVSQSSRMWTNHVAPPTALPFTPVYLISASLPVLFQRRVTRVPRSIPSAPDGVEPESSRRADETVSYVYAFQPSTSYRA